jgi:hypothetical protein
MDCEEFLELQEKYLTGTDNTLNEELLSDREVQYIA